MNLRLNRTNWLLAQRLTGASTHCLPLTRRLEGGARQPHSSLGPTALSEEVPLQNDHSVGRNNRKTLCPYNILQSFHQLLLNLD